jgi:hypothetical protein
VGTRTITTSFGQDFEVPSHIVRIDSKRTHGWQLRFGQWKMYSDHSQDGSGAGRALEEAKRELLERQGTLDAATGLRTKPNKNKSSQMPVGISGPAERLRRGKNVVHYYFQVTYPVYGKNPANKSVYIGTENTVWERYDAALKKAIQLREKGVKQFKTETTGAMHRKVSGAK